MRVCLQQCVRLRALLAARGGRVGGTEVGGRQSGRTAVRMRQQAASSSSKQRKRNITAPPHQSLAAKQVRNCAAFLKLWSGTLFSAVYHFSAVKIACHDLSLKYTALSRDVGSHFSASVISWRGTALMRDPYTPWQEVFTRT